MLRLPAPEICPVCGEDVPRNALACKHCGADHNSGWREDADIYDGTDVPTPMPSTTTTSSARSLAKSAGSTRRSACPGRPHAIHPLWVITALVLLVAFFIIYFGPYL